MNDDFFIMPYFAAKKAVEEHPHKLNVISIGVHPVLYTVSEELCAKKLWLRFEDLDDETEVLPYPYAKEHHIREAIEFARENYVHIIHCSAGVSRSPAVGYAILRDQGYSKADALKKVMEKVPAALPNKRIVNIIDRMLP